MKIKLSLLIPLTILATFFSFGQRLTEDKILRLEPHPTDNAIFFAKFFSKETGRMVEYWEMTGVADKITPNNFNELVKTKAIWANGKYYKFDSSAKKEIESSYKDGKAVGNILCFYPSGEKRFELETKPNREEIANHFYKNGQLKKTEELLFVQQNGEVKEYYSDGAKLSEYNYSEGYHYGKYRSFHKNGTIKRNAKFERDAILSAKCYNENGNEIECQPFFVAPEIPGGELNLRNEINKIDFGSNTSNDTTNFRISMYVDCDGKTTLSHFHSHNNSLFYKSIRNWVNQLPTLKPFMVDGVESPVEIILAFAICKDKVVWFDGDFISTHEKGLKYTYHRPEYKYYWDFPTPDDGKVYYVVDLMPSFPDGNKAFVKYFKENAVFPKEARKKGIGGKVYIQFTITYEGKIEDAVVFRSIHPLLDNEALKEINAMPDWNPGKLRGKPVNIKYTLGIEFPQNGNQVRVNPPQEPKPLKF